MSKLNSECDKKISLENSINKVAQTIISLENFYKEKITESSLEKPKVYCCFSLTKIQL